MSDLVRCILDADPESHDDFWASELVRAVPFSQNIIKTSHLKILRRAIQ